MKSILSTLILAVSIIMFVSCGEIQKTENINEEDSTKNISEIISTDNDYLLLVEDEEGCRYVNSEGKTIIESEKYLMCFTDTFKTYAIVLHQDKGFIAINRSVETLYNIFVYDNGPDYPEDGLFRIIKDEKIGYADFLTGEILIEPIYQAAYSFENGKAKVALVAEKIQDGEHYTWESKNWIFINKTGEEI